MEKVLSFIIGIASGALAAFYGPYIAERIKANREKKSLRLAIYRELVYIFRLVSDLFDYQDFDKIKFDELAANDKKKILKSLSMFLDYYKTFIYEHDLYQFIRNDFTRLRLFYQLDDAFVIEKTYIDFYRTFTPGIWPESPEEQYNWLGKYRERFVANAREGNFSKILLEQACKKIHYGQEMISQLFPEAENSEKQ